MAQQLKPPAVRTPSALSLDPSRHDSQDELRILSRSPHPYHRQNFELLNPSERLEAIARGQLSSYPRSPKESTPNSDSGTEADDEHYLKGLPAPKIKLHKGLRGHNEPLSSPSTPLLSPAVLEEEGRKLSLDIKRIEAERDRRKAAEGIRRRREVIRRCAEVVILATLGAAVHSSVEAQEIIHAWRTELGAQGALLASLVLLYPVRVAAWAYGQGTPRKRFPIAIPSSFDPAPLLYPATIPVFVAFLTAPHAPGVVLPNLVLAICSLPRPIIPTAQTGELYAAAHWLLSCIPILLSGRNSVHGPYSYLSESSITREVAVLLYPMHQSLCLLLNYLTTTSLLTAELQLLSVALINILIAAKSPQVEILKAILWGGGLGLLILCGGVVKWGIALARVPKWRFRRPTAHQKGKPWYRILGGLLTRPLSKKEMRAVWREDSAYDSGDLTEDDSDDVTPARGVVRRRIPKTMTFDGATADEVGSVPLSPVDGTNDGKISLPDLNWAKRRHTLPLLDTSLKKPVGRTSSGRRKRATSGSVRAFFSLTLAQATLRKWLYAGYLYACILGIILVGVREHVATTALHGNEPIGWALGYLFGDVPWFRSQITNAQLEQWILLPPPTDALDKECCTAGWVQHLRHSYFGEANTRLVLSAYFMLVIAVGLVVVLQLSPIYEVDTRRKVFHFMMVAMFLPATYVDPTYAALALSLILAIFLLLDLLRASQLPPLSKPIASFLTPYVDGRDLRGPVVISHIFLLIGCAIPLWLSLASLPRGGRTAASAASATLDGWEVPTRDVSMVSGVVCVGLGDAAASLIGRRWGRRKWLWGGGKSLEGSVAFALAVFAGLVAASAWLRVGGWPTPMTMTTGGPGGPVGTGTGAGPACYAGLRWDALAQGWGGTLRRAAACASMASLTEAVLTGGNDNVVVPVVLWTCVKSLGV